MRLSTKIITGKLAGLLMVMVSCVEPYTPPHVASTINVLVVDGFLNSESDSIRVRLSRTQSLNETVPPPAEVQAIVTLEDANGASILIPEKRNGVYYRDGLSLNPSTGYRLRIKTTDGKEYESQFVTNNQTPPVDSLTWDTDGNGLNIYVDTHDPANTTHYYKWDYEETYEFTSAFESFYRYDRTMDSTLLRTPAEAIYHCWKTNISTSINLASTINLREDAITNHLVVQVPSQSVKITHEYSVLVKQYALDKGAFDYWVNLKRISESLGTLFDPQPSEISGNLKCVTNPSEHVLGYFSAGTVTTKRIFISVNDLPKWEHITGYEDCGTVLDLDTLLVADVKNSQNLLAYAIENMEGTILGYTSAPYSCIDCRLKGTNVKPSFWP